MKRIGIIDIGSNSVRLVVVEIVPKGSFKLLDELKESVRLGENIVETELINEKRMAKALETLRLFMDLCTALKVDQVICVATEAVRRAKNQQDFLKLMEKELNLKVQVITGLQEAYLDYFGAANSLPVKDGLIMDIGGSSTELVLVKGRRMIHGISLPFGSLTMSEMFNLEQPLDSQQEKAMDKYLADFLKPLDWLRSAPRLVGIGGSFRSVGKMDRKKRQYPLDIVHNYEMEAASIFEMYHRIKGLKFAQRLEVKGLSRDRADLILGAMGPMKAVLEHSGIEKVTISGSGLREGIIYEALLESQEPVADILSFSLRNIMTYFQLDQAHAVQIWTMADQLYKQLAKPLDIDPNQDAVLKTAALLHDAGVKISYYDHHKHSFYIVLNSRLNGLSQKQLLMAAWMAGLHRGEYKPPVEYRRILSPEETTTVQQLGLLLRLCESLEKRHTGNIRRLESFVDEKRVLLKAEGKADPSMELTDAMSAAASFKKIFKRELLIEKIE